MSEPLATIFRAAAIRDASTLPGGPVNLRPGAIAVRQGRIVAVGEPGAVEKDVKPQGPWKLVDLPDRLILPAMVNAHAHLDLTDIGPVPYEGAGRDFIKWIEMVIEHRPQTDEAITSAVRRGLKISREAGVGWIGDIAGSDAAVAARIAASPEEYVPGASYLECFGIGKAAEAAASSAWDRMMALSNESIAAKRNDLSIQLQPHAPYSAGLPLYQTAHNYLLGWPSTHLAETRAELEFVRDATGPFVELLKRIGKWDDAFRPTGLTPVEYLQDELEQGWWVLAHCNYVTDSDIEILARLTNNSIGTNVTVAYCPVASDYFDHRGHRYRDMLAAGVKVAIGTDSILCQPPTEPQPLGIMPQIRHVYRRDRYDPDQLLRMTTTRIPLAFARHSIKGFDVGAHAEFAAIRIDPSDPTDPLVQALLNDNLVEPIFIPIESQEESTT